jgi:hypothetical protein
VHYAYGSPKNNITFIGAVPTRGVYQTDGWGWNRIGFGYASYTRQWGDKGHAADTRIFFIEYGDFRHILKTDNRPLAARRAALGNIRIDTFGGHSVHTFESSAGIMDALFWGAVQSGRWGVQTQRAGAFDVEGGFQPKILLKVKPWLRGGFNYGSGAGTRTTTVTPHDEHRGRLRYPVAAAAPEDHDLERVPCAAPQQRE